MAESYITRKGGGGGGELEFTDELYPVLVQSFQLNAASNNTRNVVNTSMVGLTVSSNYITTTVSSILYLYHKSNLKFSSNFTLPANSFTGGGGVATTTNEAFYAPIEHNGSTTAVGRINYSTLAYTKTNINIPITSPSSMITFGNTLYYSGFGFGQNVTNSGVIRFPNVISDINNYTHIVSGIYAGDMAINNTNIFLVSGNSSLLTIEKRNASTFGYLNKANLGSTSTSISDAGRVSSQVRIAVNNGFVYAVDATRNKLIKHHESNLTYISEIDLPFSVANTLQLQPKGFFIYNNKIHLSASLGSSNIRYGLLYDEANFSFIGVTPSYTASSQWNLEKDKSSDYLYVMAVGLIRKYDTNAKSIVYKDNTYITIKK
jgi:hypothetical protein